MTVPDNYDRVRDEFHRIEKALKAAGDYLLCQNNVSADDARRAIFDPEITQCLIHIRYWLESVSITVVAASHFWRVCEILGNRAAPLDAPLDTNTLYHIKKVVDAGKAWDDFHALPRLREKYQQLSLWEEEDYA